jgi:DNA polymerase elongation subunit (family B)
MSQKFPKTCIEDHSDKVLFFPNQQEYLGKILDIKNLGPCEDFVYDIETEDGTFHAGIGNLIVKNTDSIYCHFPGYTDAKKSWLMAKKVEDQLLKLFPSPMKLVFEEKIYSKFLILTKKRYMAYTCGEDGEMDEKLTIRGVLLARRDNCKWIRMLYEQVVRALMNAETQQLVYELINQHVLDLMCWKINQRSYFVISKQVNKEYKIRPLPTEPKKLCKRLEDLGIFDYPKEEIKVEHLNTNIMNEEVVQKYPWFEKYILRSKPAHVQLASKMTMRGKPVEAGSRIEFLVIQNIDTKAKLCDRLEDPVYFKSHCDLLRLDRLYYLGCLSEPLDQLLNVVYPHKNFVSKLHDYHICKFKVMDEMKKLTCPIILLGDEVYKPPTKRKAKKKKVELIPENKSLYDYI